jgi:diaminopimelate decarboxylase
MEVQDNQLVISGVECSGLAAEYGTPLYVYDRSLIKHRYQELASCIDYSKVRIMYACKANSNLAIMKMLSEAGAGLDAVSPGEVYFGLRAGFKPEDILYTGNNSSEDEKGVMVNIGSLDQMDVYGEIASGTDIGVRINPDVGGGHHGHCITGGPESKFGIYFNRIDEIRERAKKYDLHISTIHSHIGSGILDIETFLLAMRVTLDAAKEFDDLESVDFGGGIGIPYRPSEKRLDMEEFGKQVGNTFKEFCDSYGKDITLMIEPGRYLVAEAGYLLVSVTNRKETPAHTFIGTDSGFNHLIRPMAYGSYHEIINASRVEGEKESVAVCGNLCESGDVFTRNEEGIEEREITIVQTGDILALCSAGAYGFSMASNYNGRLLPAEVMVENGSHRLVRKRQEIEDLLKGQIFS